MNKYIVGSILVAISGTSQAATLVAGQNYNMNILADGVSCFAAGDCSQTISGRLTDNNSDDSIRNVASADTLANYALGSSIAGDGYAGVINISTTDDGAGGVNFSVNSFNVDTYLGTYGGDIAVWAEDVSAMSGSVAADGSITLDLNGRLASHEFLQFLGVLPFNLDSSGVFDVFTSGTSSNVDTATGETVASLTGLSLQDDLSAVLVNAGNYGAEWGLYADTPYTEICSVQFETVSAVPVPAAVWLFGSGLLGLAGVARRRKTV